MATTSTKSRQRTPQCLRVTHLFPCILNGIQDTKEEIGHGTCTVVKKIKFRGLECVGKKAHDFFYLKATPQQKEDMLTRFLAGCEQLSRLQHPHIVQFMGVYFEGDIPLPILVMEHLHSTLAAMIERYGVLPDPISYDILHDVILGLRYLHEHSPPIAHHNLTANNVLLTPHMSAKISDLGVAKILSLSPAQMTKLAQMKAVGVDASCYMPPEALSSQFKYNTKIDIYSMGVLLTHMLCGEWPIPSNELKRDPQNPNTLIPMTDVERRAKYLQKIGDNHPLVPLIHCCLSNNSNYRPNAAQINNELEEVKAHFPAITDTKIEMFQQLQLTKDEVEIARKALKKEREQRKALKEEREEGIEALRKKNRSQSEGSLAFEPLNIEKVQLFPHPQLSQLQWKKCTDMPVEIFRLQAVTIGDEVYVGGGASEKNVELNIVCKYNQVKDEWTQLQDHCVEKFGLCQFQGKLLSVGGKSPEGFIGKVYRYSTAHKKWVESLKPMPTKRVFPALLTTESAIISCGGDTEGDDNAFVPSRVVEVYSNATSQWHTADPLPQPCTLISSVTVEGIGYLLGGIDSEQPIRSPFFVDMATLIDRATSSTRHRDTWKTLPDTLVTSIVAALSGGLITVGGLSDKVQSTVHILTPSTNSWVKLPSGDLPTQRYLSAAAQLSNNRVMVIGGRDEEHQNTSTCYIGSVVV